MGKPMGIIYGTLALFRWSSAYPNARLIVVGIVMAAPLPFLLLERFSTVIQSFDDIAATQSELEFTSSASLLVMGLIVSIHFAGMWILIFAIGRIANGLSRIQLVNPPAPTPDAASKSS
jgi:hypothetical protein